MSLNTAENSLNSAERKRASSPIRKYFSPTTSIATTQFTTKKPLSAINDNIQESPNDKNKRDDNNKKEVGLQQSRFLDYYKSRRAHQPSNSNASTEKTKIEKPLPSLKRSHSAISSLDTANETWMNSPLKSNKKPKDNKQVYDRLTPSITDMPSAQLLMNKSDFNHNDEESYQIRIAKAIGLDPTKRVLSYNQRPPSLLSADIRKNAPQPKLKTHSAPQVKRHILSAPERVLDAPFMADDYYLNLLDWSKNNVVAIGLDKAVYLWNADAGTIQALNYDQDVGVTSLNWSSDGSFLAVGTANGITQIWDAKANTKLRSMTGQDCRIGVLGWDRHLVSSGGSNGSIFNHDVRLAKHVVRELYGHEDEVCGLKWRWDGELLATGGNDNTVNIWDARSSQPKFTKRAHVGAVKALAWCPWNRNLLATGGGRDDTKINFWNTTLCSRVNSITTGSQVTSLTWSQHYKEIASTHGFPNNHITVWGYPSLNKIIDIPAHESRILHSAMSPDGEVLATAAADENLKFWRLFEAGGKARLTTESNRITSSKEALLRRSKTIR